MDATLDYVEKRGEERGEKRGEKRAFDLYRSLVRDKRLEEWEEALNDERVLQKLLKEYSLIDD